MTLDLRLSNRRIPNLHAPSRRELMLASGTLFAWAFAPKIARAEGRDPRLLTIVLRGALDGLAAVAPVGDPDWTSLRGDKALALTGATAGLPLDSFFALNPAMPNLHRLYKSGAATIVHAAATPYRERSHFDGQDVLESGVLRPGASETGWLNRALTALAPDGRAGAASRDAFAVGPLTPLVVRGPAPVLSWTPPRLPPANDDTMMRLLDLYRHTDPALARALEERMGLAAIAGAGGPAKSDQKPQPGAVAPGPAAQVRAYFAQSAGMAAKFLAQPDGPRIGALAFDGWDTHADEGALNGRLAALLGALDGALAAIESNMGPAWRDTVVVVVTEFGRTARINGTEGTDHGTATVAFLAGGALKGGRVIADWPGLKLAQLQDGRDLKPTTDLRAVVKGLLHGHLRVDEAALSAKVFPDSGAVKPMMGLLA
ncbi:MAG TPA: DUF1501 domain-containing protein [Xanthobacteraceae bacterium]|jgi:uncharacterized protein (DUF1501 family)|nr:DUF1501 domain-containing protein [Xanthobacteraceae bacterium]